MELDNVYYFHNTSFNNCLNFCYKMSFNPDKKTSDEFQMDEKLACQVNCLNKMNIGHSLLQETVKSHSRMNLRNSLYEKVQKFILDEYSIKN